MQNQIKVVSIQPIPNCNLTPHTQAQLEHLVKKKTISPQLITYNNILIKYIEGQHKMGKGVEFEKGLGDIEKVQIMNNTFSNKAELILKVPVSANFSDKQIKNIIDHHKSAQ